MTEAADLLLLHGGESYLGRMRRNIPTPVMTDEFPRYRGSMGDGAAAAVPDAGENEYLARAVRGDLAAFEALVRYHHSRVRAYLATCVRDPDLADDLAQDTFIAAFRSLPGRDPGAPFIAWLLRIARNRVRWHQRDEGVRLGRIRDQLAVALDLGAQGEGTTDLVDEERSLAALERCLAGLPEPAATLVRDHYYARTPLVAMARTLGRKEGAVRMALLRVRHLLRDCVQRRLLGGGT